MVIHARIDAPKWKDPTRDAEAMCRKFPLPSREFGRTEDPWFSDAKEALPVCNGISEDGSDACPLRAQCLTWSLTNNDTYGVFGGMTVPQRKWIRRNVPRDLWTDEYLREQTPEPGYFKNFGDDDETEDDL